MSSRIPYFFFTFIVLIQSTRAEDNWEMTEELSALLAQPSLYKQTFNLHPRQGLIDIKISNQPLEEKENKAAKLHNIYDTPSRTMLYEVLANTLNNQIPTHALMPKQRVDISKPLLESGVTLNSLKEPPLSLKLFTGKSLIKVRIVLRPFEAPFQEYLNVSDFKSLGDFLYLVETSFFKNAERQAPSKKRPLFTDPPAGMYS